MGAAKKISKSTNEVTNVKTTKKLTLVETTQQSFDLVFDDKANVREITPAIVTNVTKSSTMYFEGLDNDREVLAKKLLDKFRLLKVAETASSKYQKHSVASRYINEQTLEEIFPWAIEKSLEKYHQSKLAKEFECLTNLPENVTELYPAKVKREARIKEIQDYFWANVHENSSVMVFKEFNEIWNYAYKIFQSKVSNIYRDTVRMKEQHEYIDFTVVEDCLELNEFSEHFVRNEENVDVSKELLEILAERIGRIDPHEASDYLNVFKLHFCDEKDLTYTCQKLRIDRHKGARMRAKIAEIIEDLRDEYMDRMSA